jgi:hypothetical protein
VGSGKVWCGEDSDALHIPGAIIRIWPEMRVPRLRLVGGAA